MIYQRLVVPTSQSKVFPSPGRCIYCGDTQSKLTDEHIVPLSLGGTWVLKKASCTPCAEETARFEGNCARGIFGPLRVRNNLPTRRKKERPSSLPLTRLLATGAEETISLPVADHPGACALFPFPYPGALQGREESDAATEFESRPWVGGTQVGPNAVEVGKKLGGIGLILTHDNYSYARMLAKIGYSFAIAHLGPNFMDPTCLDLIMGRVTNWAHWVGGDLDCPPPCGPRMHILQAGIQGEFCVVAIRLFANIGAPQYYAVVGRRRGRFAMA